MKRLYFTIIIYMLLEPMWISLHAQENPQTIRGLVYCLEHRDSCMVLDMNIDLHRISLIPDCTVYLYPWLRNGADSLMLAPVMLNGPQSDLMYRRRKALGTVNKIEKLPPYIILREGDHPLPCINYRRTDIPYSSWMDSAKVILHDESYNADARLVPFRIKTETTPMVIVMKVDTIVRHDTLIQRDTIIKYDTIIRHDTIVRRDTIDRYNTIIRHDTIVRRDTIDRYNTIIRHDTVWIEKYVTRPSVMPQKKETATKHTGYRANIYFPVGGLNILTEHEINREAWHRFTSELDSLRLSDGNIIPEIIVTGYSSPEGDYAANESLARRRAQALKEFLDNKYNSGAMEIRTEWVAEDWDGLEQLVRASDMPDKNKVLDIIDNTDALKEREPKLRVLSGGKPWAYMLKEFFPKLRRVSCRIGYVKRTQN